MKIAAISDIHGNVEAFNAVMEDIKKNECEKVFVLGDYAMAGPEPGEIIDFFRNHADDSKYTLIQGNTDQMIVEYKTELYNTLKSKAPVMAEALKDDANTLSNSQKIFLERLPQQLEITEGGVKFLLVHGSPRRNNEDILPTMSLPEVERIVNGVNADVILCGHTHIPCGFQTTDKKTIVNVGSVGRPFTTEPKACYLIIDAAYGRCVFTHKFIEYDKETAAQKMQTRNFKGSDKLAKTLLNPTERHF